MVPDKSVKAAVSARIAMILCPRCSDFSTPCCLKSVEAAAAARVVLTTCLSRALKSSESAYLQAAGNWTKRWCLAPHRHPQPGASGFGGVAGLPARKRTFSGGDNRAGLCQLLAPSFVQTHFLLLSALCDTESTFMHNRRMAHQTIVTVKPD